MNRNYQQIDPLIHQPARLSIMAALAAAQEIEFATLRDLIHLSDSLLSRYTRTLEEAGYLEIKKGFVTRRPKTWLLLTPKGRNAFDAHVELLKQIIGTAE